MNHFTCPSCGARYLIVPEGEGEMKRGFLARLLGRGQGEFEAARPWEPSSEQPAILNRQLDWREIPAGTPTVPGHFAVPALQTIGSTVAFALGAAGIGLAYFMKEWSAPVRWWIGSVSGVLVVSWFLLLFDTRKLLRVVESFINVDLDGDGVKGKPAPGPDEGWVRGEITDADRRQVKRVQFPFPPDLLQQVAVAVLNEECRFSRNGLSDVTSGTKFRKLQQEFLKRGLCHWKDPEYENLGVTLHPSGRAFLRMHLPK